jgi:hypothetical protein
MKDKTFIWICAIIGMLGTMAVTNLFSVFLRMSGVNRWLILLISIIIYICGSIITIMMTRMMLYDRYKRM